MSRRDLYLELALVLFLVAIGVGIGWAVFKPVPPVVERPAAAVTQADGSVVLERAPDAQAKPAAEIPKGAKIERVMSVTVQPHATTASTGGGLKSPAADAGSAVVAPSQACPPVKVDLALVRMPDQTRRVVASSKDGDILGGVDIPVETAPLPEEPRRWAAGLSWVPQHQTWGAWVERDVGRIRFGAEINQTRPLGQGSPLTAVETRLRIGMTF